MVIESKFRDFYDCIAKRPDLVPKPKEPRPITSKQKAAAHGFDTKTSFRKDTPPTRKQKRA